MLQNPRTLYFFLFENSGVVEILRVILVTRVERDATFWSLAVCESVKTFWRRFASFGVLATVTILALVESIFLFSSEISCCRISFSLILLVKSDILELSWIWVSIWLTLKLDKLTTGETGLVPRIAGTVFSFAKFNRIRPKSETKLL